MKEGSWADCINGRACIQITPDNARARSLLDTSTARIRVAKKQELNQESARFILEDYYSSAIEVLHALLLINGFNSDSHICLGFFIRDILKRSDLFSIFDTARLRRNSIVYYGKDLSYDKAIESINRITFLIAELKKMM